MKAEGEASGWTAGRFGLLSALVFTVVASPLLGWFVLIALDSSREPTVSRSHVVDLAWIALWFVSATSFWGYVLGRPLARAPAVRSNVSQFALTGALVATASATTFACLLMLETGAYLYLGQFVIAGLIVGLLVSPLGALAGVLLWMLKSPARS